MDAAHGGGIGLPDLPGLGKDQVPVPQIPDELPLPKYMVDALDALQKQGSSKRNLMNKVGAASATVAQAGGAAPPADHARVLSRAGKNPPVKDANDFSIPVPHLNSLDPYQFPATVAVLPPPPAAHKRKSHHGKGLAASPQKIGKADKIGSKGILDDSAAVTATASPKKKSTEKFSWSEMFFQLVLYRARNGGSSDVPKGYFVEVGGDEQVNAEGGPSGAEKKRRSKVKLGAWVQEMRRCRRALTSPTADPVKAAEAALALTPQRIEALDSVDFAWENVKANPRSFRHDLWRERYDMLVEFHARHGHCDVPKEEGLLHRWCNNQRDLNAEVTGTKVEMGPSARKCAGWGEEISLDRKKRLQGKQTTDFKKVWMTRKAKLDELGFVWRKRGRTSWEDRLEELKQYKAEFGNCLVPQHYARNRQLGKWVNKVRTEYNYFQQGKKSAMTEDRIALLEAINFEWTTMGKGRPSTSRNRQRPAVVKFEPGDRMH